MAEGFVALFPGQGSQHVGMAKALCQDFQAAREVFEEASDGARLDLKRLSFDGPEADLTLTENTQPCLLAASVAAFRVARAELGFAPGAVAGHSVGEYSALVAAGALPLATAARWVRERGAAMQKAVPAGQGTMAAILGLDDSAVLRLCEQATVLARRTRASDGHAELTVPALVEPANFNSPGQVVIAGSVDGVAAAIRLVRGNGPAEPPMPDFAGGKIMPLSVSAPFHCKLMGPARARMAELFAAARPEERPRTPACPYAPNRTARLTSEAGLVFELLVEQVDHPVLWKQTVLSLLEAGFTRGVELGPGRVLQGLAKRIPDPAGRALSMSGVSDPATLRTFEAQLKGGAA
jgi:[acyl-carrier-protein] S-malonyltransferase